MESVKQSSISNQRSSGLVGYFASSASAILLLTGLAKVVSSFGKDRVLSELDPVFGFSYRTLFLSVGLLELVVAVALLVSSSPLIRLVLIAWLVSTFWIYRSAVHSLGNPKPCKCLGTLTHAIHISDKTAERIMFLALCYLTLGAAGLLIREALTLKPWKHRLADNSNV